MIGFTIHWNHKQFLVVCKTLIISYLIIFLGVFKEHLQKSARTEGAEVNLSSSTLRLTIGPTCAQHRPVAEQIPNIEPTWVQHTPNMSPTKAQPGTSMD